MKPKLLAGLAVVAVIAVGGAIAVTTSLRQSTSAPEATQQRLFPEVVARADDIRAIVIASKDASVRLARDGDRWTVPDKFNYAAATDKVRKLLGGLAELRALEAKSSSPENYAFMEVENIDAANAKSVRIALQDGAGKDIVAVIVGKQRFAKSGTAGDGVYVRRADNAQAWLAQGRLSIERDMLAWLERKVTDVSRDRVRQTTVHGEKTLVVERAKPDDKDFAIKDMPADRKVKSAWDVNSVGGAFESVEFDDVRPAADLEFAATSPSATAETFDGLSVTATLADRDNATWVRFAAKSQPPAQPVEGAKLKSAEDVAKEVEAVNARTGGWAYKLPNYKLESMRKKLDDLIEPKDKAS